MSNNPPKITEITVTPELVDSYCYSDVKGCALFQALRLVGIAVSRVGFRDIALKDGTRPRIVPPFGFSDYLKVKKTRKPFTVLLIPEVED